MSLSGPLFFGFSDPVTMRALASLYTPDELEACKRGGVVESAEYDPLEALVKALCRLEGVGHKTATALATSTAFSTHLENDLGGGGGGGGGGPKPPPPPRRRLTSVDEFRACASSRAIAP